MAELWRALGCRASTRLRVLTDGDRGMSHLVQASAPGTSGHVLDWFHIAMRLQAIRRSLGASLRRAGFEYSGNEAGSRRGSTTDARQTDRAHQGGGHGSRPTDGCP